MLLEAARDATAVNARDVGERCVLHDHRAIQRSVHGVRQADQRSRDAVRRMVHVCDPGIRIRGLPTSNRFLCGAAVFVHNAAVGIPGSLRRHGDSTFTGSQRPDTIRALMAVSAPGFGIDFHAEHAGIRGASRTLTFACRLSGQLLPCSPLRPCPLARPAWPTRRLRVVLSLR